MSEATLHVETVKVTTLAVDPANTRKHGKRNIQTIKASLTKFGQQKPIVVDAKGVVVAGNGTLEAAIELRWKSIDVVRTGLTGVEATAFAIADNRTSELAEWDDGALAELLAALRDDDAIDHLVTGFTDDDIARVIAEALPFKCEPGVENEQGRLDRKSPIKCPHCGREFVPK